MFIPTVIGPKVKTIKNMLSVIVFPLFKTKSAPSQLYCYSKLQILIQIFYLI